MTIRILLPADKDLILAYERERLTAKHDDDMELEMESWTARWRGESLEHYLKMGWSFALVDAEKLHGYILAQPILFFRGHTQTLWVEHIAAHSKEAEAQLIDTVHKWARDKHLQCVVREEFPGGPLIELKSARYTT